MSKTVLHDGDEGVSLVIRDPKHKSPRRTPKAPKTAASGRSPVHVVYGGADLYNRETPAKLGRIALASLTAYVPNGKAFAGIFGVAPKGSAIVFDRVKAKLAAEPIEDLRIDFEDGYGFRPDSEEDADAERCANELAATFADGTITPFSGFRVKSYASETGDRARRTLNIFLDEFLAHSKGKLPDNFVVTLPKITDKKEVSAFCRDLKRIEKMARVKPGSIRIELMVEHPLSLIDKKGNFALREIVGAARGRCVAAHFGAYDYTAAIGIAATHQDIAHPACDFARQMMLAALSPLGIRLSDSVTPQMPVGPHRGKDLSAANHKVNSATVADGLKRHFDNVSRSMANGFYQSWDLHPNQLIARYAAVYVFFLSAVEAQGARLRSFVEKATKATLTGNTFDDAATAAGIVNFFRQGLDCGAFAEREVEAACGLSAAEIRTKSFSSIAASVKQA